MEDEYQPFFGKSMEKMPKAKVKRYGSTQKHADTVPTMNYSKDYAGL